MSILYDYPKDEYSSKYEQVISRKKQGEFTIDDLRELPEGTRVELIDGVIYDLAAPTTRHQFIVTKLASALGTIAEGSGHDDCLVLVAPTDVQINKDDDKNVLQPDVFVVCDREKYAGEEDEIIGAPDFVAEVLSPSTERYDRIVKLNKYSDAGVREYWMINIEDEEITVYLLYGNEGSFKRYSFKDTIPLTISGGEATVDFKKISDRMHMFFG